MATKAYNVAVNNSGTHTVTRGSSVSLDDAVLVAIDDTAITTKLELWHALNAVQAAIGRDLLAVSAPGDLSTSGEFDV